MSYSCQISLKKVKAEEIYSFFQQLKKEVEKNSDAIAESEFIWAPACKFFRRKYTFKLENEQRDWVKRIFTYRWFYLPKQELLGVFGVPGSVKSLFEATYYFQNSCDQDYEFSDWKGIKYFEDIASKWENMSDKEFYKAFKDYDPEPFEEYIGYDPQENSQEYLRDKIGYYKRSMCYDEIWKYFEDFLYNDSESVYLTLFREYDDLCFIKGFAYKCWKTYKEWLKKEVKNSEEKPKTQTP